MGPAFRRYSLDMRGGEPGSGARNTERMFSKPFLGRDGGPDGAAGPPA